MPAQPAPFTSLMPYTHRPRRRSRRPRTLAALLICSCLALATTSATAAVESVPPQPALGWRDSLPEQSVGRDSLRVHLQARAASSAMGNSTSTSTRKASSSAAVKTSSTTAAATAATSAAIVLADGTNSVSSIAADGALAVSSESAAMVTTGTGTLTSTSSAAVSTSTAVPAGYAIPEAFDSTLGTNFTSTNCPSFFATFLADPTFTACDPFSLLLTTSTAFFTAERSPYSLLPYVLDASCAADSTTCTALMDTLAREIKGTGACGADLALGNPLATEALQGFLNYRLYREVGCQKSNSTEATYCFADAAANSQPDDLYTYYAGEGTSLPSGTTPDCGSCTQGLFAIYARYATNSTLPISKTYSSARSAIAVSCGPSFAPAITVATSFASSLHPSLPTLLLVLPTLFIAALAAS